MFGNLRFVKENLSKDTTGTRRRTHVTGRRKFCATPILANKEAGSAKLQKLSNDLYSIGQGTVRANLIKGNSFEPSSFYTTSITQQNEHKDKRPSRTSVKEVLHQLNGDCNFNGLSGMQQQFVKLHLEIDKSRVIEIEESTLLQSLSPVWFVERKKRPTASNFGLVVKRRQIIYPKSILQKLQNKRFISSACEWGLDNEEKAIMKYEDQTGMVFEKVGLIVNPK